MAVASSSKGFQGTPGPWSLRHSRISWWIEAPSDMSRFAHGPIPADVWHLETEERDRCEALRNARLIAASPTMAADLRSAWAVLSIILDNGWVPAEHLAPVEQCRDNAARTLSTALGEDR